MIDSAFILRVFGDLELLESLGIRVGEGSPSCRLAAGEAEGAERRVAAVADQRRSHTTSLPD